MLQARLFSTGRHLTHTDEAGKLNMINVGHKADTTREATAKGQIKMNPDTLELIAKNQIKKGDVLTVARIAGIMAAKQTSALIPLCHPLMLSTVDVKMNLDAENSAVMITATVSCSGKTGVEMEALMAVSVAACTLFDMCKAVDKSMVIGQIRVVEKKGGKSGHYLSI